MGKINQETAKRPHLHILKIDKSLGSKSDALIKGKNGTATAFTKRLGNSNRHLREHTGCTSHHIDMTICDGVKRTGDKCVVDGFNHNLPSLVVIVKAS